MAGPLFKSRLRPWVGLTHGLVWAGSDRVGLGQSVDGSVGSGHTKWTHGQLWCQRRSTTNVNAKTVLIGGPVNFHS